MPLSGFVYTSNKLVGNSLIVQSKRQVSYYVLQQATYDTNEEVKITEDTPHPTPLHNASAIPKNPKNRLCCIGMHAVSTMTQRPRRELSRPRISMMMPPDEKHRTNRHGHQRYVKAIAAAALSGLLLYALVDNFPSVRACKQTIVASSDRFADEAARPARWQHLTTLVLVAGHAIFVSPSWDSGSLTDESNWVLEKFQRGQVKTFLEHVRKGVLLTANDSDALLLFSGGQTRQGAGPRSEGLTYWLAADSNDWFGNSQVRNRSLAEEYARDSMENLLFSVCRFRQVVGRYPSVIKVVGFGFKRIRFVDMHRRALRFPAHRFEYFGIDPDGVDGMRGVTAGERSQAMGPFAGDPYGCKTRVLSDKRMERNPYLRYHPYPQGCPELTGLFRHCGRSIFSGPLPWDPRVNPVEEDRQR